MKRLEVERILVDSRRRIKAQFNDGTLAHCIDSDDISNTFSAFETDIFATPSTKHGS